ncbi:spermatogenesis associated 6-like protein isoform X1 [Ascaphus truei]|uniref:spermatogenesis associated 6-like protein isoform X1 n=2 Tax=Ascaphus truei TaxID=8439 RepID=UPI003F59C40F
MPLKVVIELQVHAVTCPGVLLPEKDDIFLSVSILGQCKETKYLPSVFPLLLHEKMRFEKVFRKAIDPAAVVQLLESHTASFELIQQTYPVGDILAFYEANTREFLFPEPKLTPPYPGVDREVLMKTARGFPGIAPKIEFSTRTTIKEQTADFQKKCLAANPRNRRSIPSSPRKSSASPKKRGRMKSTEKNFDVPTRSSKSRSPSPYTRRRVCELNKDNQQRLAQLNLGSFEFKSDIDTRPPFIVRHVDHSKPLGELSASQLRSPKTKNHSRSSISLHKPQLKRALSFDSFQDAKSEGKVLMDSDEFSSTRKGSSLVDIDDFRRFPFKSSTRSLQDGRTSPILSLRERLRSDKNTWESIHNRVRNLLSTHSAKQRLSFGLSNREVDDILERRSISSRRSPNNRSIEQRF